ncbi:MAG: YhfC family intramembrane metalloprotease [Erysipelotrichaceae bacterium]|nr:YhfC family intramembrane metalloprotease [Erysipelotrichaceae bacterium]MDY6035647.1 YhfC family glutamic-type intramembrane protease [Bulleidia sp.]
MNLTVSFVSIACMVASCIVAFGFPIFLALRYRKLGGQFGPVGVGVLVMLVFALVIEGNINRIVLSSSIGTYIQSHTILYALYGGSMAAIFEEFGRYVACKTRLKKYQDNDVNALMYGVGHGGLESMVIVGLTMLNYIVIAIMMNQGTIQNVLSTLDQVRLASVNGVMQTLASTPSYIFLLSGVERIAALLAQISMSVLVWFSVKTKHKKYFVFSMILHFMLDAGSVLIQGYTNNNLVFVEIYVVLMAVVSVYIAYNAWSKFHPFIKGQTKENLA